MEKHIQFELGVRPLSVASWQLFPEGYLFVRTTNTCCHSGSLLCSQTHRFWKQEIDSSAAHMKTEELLNKCSFIMVVREK